MIVNNVEVILGTDPLHEGKYSIKVRHLSAKNGKHKLEMCIDPKHSTNSRMLMSAVGYAGAHLAESMNIRFNQNNDPSTAYTSACKAFTEELIELDRLTQEFKIKVSQLETGYKNKPFGLRQIILLANSKFKLNSVLTKKEMGIINVWWNFMKEY